jgi:hypothetical protein
MSDQVPTVPKAVLGSTGIATASLGDRSAVKAATTDRSWRVLVPDEEGLALFSASERLRPERYTDVNSIPDLGTIDVYVPRFLSRPDPALLANMWSPKLVQLLTAGYEGWRLVLPAGVALSNSHTAHGRCAAEWVAATSTS